MKTNFSFLHSLERNPDMISKYPFIDWKNIYESLIEVEKDVMENKYRSIGNVARTIVETLINHMIDVLGCDCDNYQNLSFSLKDKLYICFQDERISKYKKIKDFFMMIIKLGNDQSHSLKSISKCEAWLILQYLRDIIIFFIKNVLTCDYHYLRIDDIDFDVNIYFDGSDYQIISREETIKNKKLIDTPFNDININQIPIAMLLLKENRRFKIPMYQRGYDWEKENIEEFLDDIKLRSIDNSPHYFGIIACKKEVDSSGEIINILDGQQRLTTSLIFIKVLRDYYNDRFNENINMNNDYGFDWLFPKNRDGSDVKYVDIIQNVANSNNDEEVFNLVLSDYNYKSLFAMYGNWENSKVWKSYNTMFDWLSKEFSKKEFDTESEKEEILKITKTFVTQFKIGLIEFNKDIFKIKQELEIFENLNSKGKSLSIIDLIKNYLFFLCNNYTLSNPSPTSVINNYFKEKVSSEFIETKIKFNSDEFLGSLVHFFTGKEENVKNESKFLKSFKNIIESKIEWNLFSSIDENVQELDVDQYKIIIQFINYFINSYKKVKKLNKKTINEYSHITYSLNMTISTMQSKKISSLFAVDYMILYFVIKQNKGLNNNINIILDKEIETINKIYLIVIKYIILSFIRTGQGDSELKRTIFETCHKITFENDYHHKSLNDIYLSLKKLLFKENNKITFQDTKRTIYENDENIKSIHETLLMLIELNECEKSNTNSKEFFSKGWSLEYIMPKEFDLWVDDIKNWNNIKESKESDQFQNECKNNFEKIGNAILLESSLTTINKNNPFDIKKEWLNKNASKLFLFNNQNNDIDIANKNKWSFNDIQNRSKAIKDYLIDEIFKECFK